MKKAKAVKLSPGVILLSKEFSDIRIEDKTRGSNWTCTVIGTGKSIVLSPDYLRGCTAKSYSVTPDSPDTQPELDEEPAIDSEGNVILGLGETTGQAAGEDADVDEEIETPTESDDSSEMDRAYTRIMSQEEDE